MFLSPRFTPLPHPPPPILFPAPLCALLAMIYRYHMKRCEDSGLWVPGAGGSSSVGEGEDEDEDGDEVENFEVNDVSDGESEPEGPVGEDDATVTL